MPSHTTSTAPLLLAAVFGGLLIACASGAGQTGDDDAVRAARLAPADTVARSRLPPEGEAWVIVDSDTVHAEVAATANARQQGLMNRRTVPEGTGMLFVFTSEALRSFWMRDTTVPLDIAFLDESMRIVDIQQMEPESDEYHTSSDPAMFALEVPRGWFESRDIEVGDEAEIIFGPR